MPTVKTEGIHNGEWLISDSGTRSREQRTFTAANGVAYPSGTVLGKITASGKYIPSLNAAADGSQTAVEILLYEVPAGAARDVQVATVARDAEVWSAMLNGGTALESGVAGELLSNSGIVVRS